MSAFSADDHCHMERALCLAERGAYTTRPNPMVGCVIVHDGEVVERVGTSVLAIRMLRYLALRAAGDCARGATAYATLEPCAHSGRTLPCAMALIDAGVRRVVAADGQIHFR